MAITWRKRSNHQTARGRIARRTLVLAASVGVGIASIVSGTAAHAGQLAAANQRYFLDCRYGNDAAKGTTPQAAWRTLARVNAVTFQAGDSILLRRGTTCAGVLAPQGSGASGNPIVVSAYGAGTRPAIAAGGARAAVFLHNVSGWEIRHLDVSDQTAPDGTARTGIYVLLENYGTGSHYVVNDVKVHDVTGCDCIDPNAEESGGILFKAAGSAVPTGFDRIQVSGNTVSGVDGFGIGTESQWSARAQYPAGTGSFAPISHVRISWNRLTNLGGDGIAVHNGVDPLIEYNSVNGFSLRATTFHAGIWAFNSDHPVMQFNQVSHGGGPLPTWAYDVDGADSNVVYQYNYSHDNSGGFMFLCAVPGTYTDGATVRYNISQNDKGAQLGTLVIPVVTNGCGGPSNPETNVHFYNNVLYTTAATALVGTLGQTSIAFSNNVFFGQPSGSAILDPVGSYDHNLYFNISPVPPGDSHAVTADPLFTNPGAGVFGYWLKCGSPALGAGTVIADNGGRDFYGFPVQTGTPPNIGAYQGPCVSG